MLDFRKKREEAGLNQSQLAEKIGISRQAISNIELGIAKPTVENAKKLGEILHFDWTEFYAESVKGQISRGSFKRSVKTRLFDLFTGRAGQEGDL